MIAIIADIGASGARHAFNISETKERVPDPFPFSRSVLNRYELIHTNELGVERV